MPASPVPSRKVQIVEGGYRVLVPDNIIHLVMAIRLVGSDYLQKYPLSQKLSFWEQCQRKTPHVQQELARRFLDLEKCEQTETSVLQFIKGLQY